MSPRSLKNVTCCLKLDMEQREMSRAQCDPRASNAARVVGSPTGPFVKAEMGRRLASGGCQPKKKGQLVGPAPRKRVAKNLLAAKHDGGGEEQAPTPKRRPVSNDRELARFRSAPVRFDSAASSSPSNQSLSVPARLAPSIQFLRRFCPGDWA